MFVSGLHMARGLALEFVSRLEYIRPGVHLTDGQNGHYADVLFDEAPRVAFLLIDFYRYDKGTQRAAEMAKRHGHEVYVVADSYCVWAHKVADGVFDLPTNTGLYWHSNAAISVLLNLLVNDVIRRLGNAVPKRIDKVLEGAEDLRPVRGGSVSAPAMAALGRNAGRRPAALPAADRGGGCSSPVSPARACSAPIPSS